MDYDFSDSSAIRQARYGAAPKPTRAAWDYIEMRMNGYSPEEANLMLEPSEDK
jgi:hypothetical protein